MDHRDPETAATVIDLHSHVLVGIDDGPTEVAAALALLRALVDDGVERVCATPHVTPEYPTSVDRRDQALEALREAARSEVLPITVEQGGELDLAYAASWSDEELDAFTLAGGRALLIEFPWGGAWPLALAPTCRALRLRGYLPIVAHPERSRAVQAAPERIDELVVCGAVIQLTAGSLTGRFGSSARSSAETLIRTRRAHVVASDAHDAVSRPPDLTAARGHAPGWLFEAGADVLAGVAPRIPRW